MVVWIPIQLGVMAFWRVPATLGTPLNSIVFLLCCFLNYSSRVAFSLFIESEDCFFFFSLASLSLTRNLILLLISGKVLPNHGSVFPFLLRAGNVTCWYRLAQYCPCSKRVYLRCSLLSLSRFNTLCSFHSPSCPPCCISAFLGSSTFQQCNFFFRTPCTYTSTVQSYPSDPPHRRLRTSYHPSAHSVTSLSAHLFLAILPLFYGLAGGSSLECRRSSSEKC